MDYDILMLGYAKPFEGWDRYYSNAIAYLVSFLVDNNIDVDWVENIDLNKDALITKLMNNNYKLIGLSTSFMFSFEEIRDVIKFIRKYSDTKIIVGGTHIKYIWDDKKFDMLPLVGANYYINSTKGETTLLNVIQYERGDIDSLDSIMNLCYMHNGEYKYTFSSIDPAKFEEHIIHWNLFTNELCENVSVRSAISCPFSCAFCAHKADGGAWELAPIENIIKELDELDKIPQVKLVSFSDNTFNVPPKRFEQLLDIMIEKHYHFKWESYIRCQYITKNLARKMKLAGCVKASLGLESGSNTMLTYMNKQTTTQELRDGIKNLQENGIYCFGTFLIGFPGETKETVMETIEFVKELNLESYVQPWLNVGNAPINKDKRFKIVGGVQNWQHETMNFEEANRWSQYVMEQTQAFARGKWTN